MYQQFCRFIAVLLLSSYEIPSVGRPCTVNDVTLANPVTGPAGFMDSPEIVNFHVLLIQLS